MSRASALAVVTDTGGAGGVGAEAADVGAQATGAALMAALGAAASAGFLSLQPGKTRAATVAHKANEEKEWFMRARVLRCTLHLILRLGLARIARCGLAAGN